MQRAALILALLFLCGCSGLPTAPVQTVSTVPAETVAIIATAESTSPPDPVMTLLDSLSVEEKVGQLFLARCPEEGALEDIKKYHLGGYILFSRDFDNETPKSIIRTISSYQKAASLPMLIAVDEEGGGVCRVSANPQFRSSRFSSLRKLYSSGGLERILEEETEKCQLLTTLGINVNMAPVCDITTDPNAFMYKRSLGQDAETTAQCISLITQQMKTGKIGSVLKHFPGYGNNKDTHTGIVKDVRSLSQLEQRDLLPFQAGINTGCDAILISHTIVAAIDESLPASLSGSVISYLRNTMQFNGVIVTDDLAMKAITKIYPVGEAAVMAVLAGNDLLCSSDYQQQYAAILDAVNIGRISKAQLDSAVYRVLQWKFALELLEF